MIARIVFGLLVLCAARTGGAEPRLYEIDPQHLTLAFLVDHVGFAKVFGRFREAGGNFTFDEAAGEISNVRVVVRTASVDTTVEPRDRHLRIADFLNVEKFPEMTFESRETTELQGREGELRGNLTQASPGRWLSRSRGTRAPPRLSREIRSSRGCRHRGAFGGASSA